MRHARFLIGPNEITKGRSGAIRGAFFLVAAPGSVDSAAQVDHYICYGYIKDGYTEPMPPLTPAVFHILLSLADGERHGYAIMQEVAARTGNKSRMGPGTLYGTLKRLLETGLVAEAGERADPAMNAERRKYYWLTDEGRNAAIGEAHRLEALVRSARNSSLLGPVHA